MAPPTVYVIGIGAGDPEHLTLQAAAGPRLRMTTEALPSSETQRHPRGLRASPNRPLMPAQESFVQGCNGGGVSIGLPLLWPRTGDGKEQTTCES